MLRNFILVGCLLSAGCSMLPEIAHQPTLHNPFPQLSKVAVVPFFNLSDEPTVDGQLVALAYFNALQSVPGFEVVPVNVVERAIQENKITFSGPADARRLAQLLEVDAVVIGAVTDFTPYYPPRFGLQVEWYAANPCFHPIPPGYGLPRGTPEEEQIPAPLVFEAELALAKAQLDTQTPSYQAVPAAATLPSAADDDRLDRTEPGMPPDWPDPRGFIPPPPSRRPPTCQPTDAAVIRHTRIYNGDDMEFTEALRSYSFFRDDARFGGWQGVLQRSDEFIRFCCHMHVSEMLSARGGAGETRVVWRWPTIR